ncbi:MAG: ABC transporter substrate-binding protein [bacterium]
MKLNFIFLIVILAVALVFYLKNPFEERVASNQLRFVSLAWQEQALAANKAIVAAWNASHPEMPVEYVQGTWSSIHDYLITAFETGEVPDVFHYESSIIVDFAIRGYLADLAPMLAAEMKQDILEVAWAAVTRPNGEIVGVPFLIESTVVLYNQDLFAQAQITPPSFDQPWRWNDLRAAARRLTKDLNNDGVIDQWGAAFGLRNSANLVMNLAISFGGSFFRQEGEKHVVRVGEAEKELLNTIMEMLYHDQSTSLASIGQSGPSMIPGFFNGKYAMLVGIGAWARQQLVENAPAEFRWGVIPPLAAVNQNTGISAQTLSIPQKSKRKTEAMAFIDFMLSPANMTQLAQSDWMIPARRSCLAMPQFQTAGDGWEVVSASAKFLATGSWLGVPGYVEWKSRVANPLLQELFANRLSVEEAARRIEIESNLVLSRYQMRDETW